GIVPNVELAAAAGLPCSNGIVVDEFARTSDPHIFAAGDCTNHPLPLLGRRVRLESVPNAIHQAKVAAASLLEAPVAYSEVPWFWSDQYDLKLQIAGLSTGFDEVVLRGDPATRSFAAFYLAAGQVLAVDAINSPKEFIAGKKLVANRARIAPDVLRDPGVDLTPLAG
ncbi:MAG TPA: oxidoreductase C-terminal domain-containing protein, partial [Gammaproteobacteria bacterium]|nr:oxidoreductase C-terminal domain-containing protein [Gammaproteobacteria bacterium]